MTEKDDRSDEGGRRSKGTGEMSHQDAGFDRWLTGHLREMYDEVLRETVPEDLVRMVRQFERSSAVGSSEQPQAEDAEAGSHSSRRRSQR
jgi:Anti-sigma factor NepR